MDFQPLRLIDFNTNIRTQPTAVEKSIRSLKLTTQARQGPVIRLRSKEEALRTSTALWKRHLRRLEQRARAEVRTCMSGYIDVRTARANEEEEVSKTTSSVDLDTEEVV